MAGNTDYEESPWYCGAAHGILVAGDVNRPINRPSMYSTKPTMTRSFDLGDMTPVDYFREHGEIGNFAARIQERNGDYDEFSTAHRYYFDYSDDDDGTSEYHRGISGANHSKDQRIGKMVKLNGEEKQVRWEIDTASEEGSDKESAATEYAIKRQSTTGIEGKSNVPDDIKPSQDGLVGVKILSRPYGDYVNNVHEGRNRPRKQQSQKPDMSKGHHPANLMHAHRALPPYHELLNGLSTAEMKLKFFRKLLSKFPENRISLEQNMGLVRTSKGRKLPSQPSIYVFVDFSNIKIGFQEALNTICGKLPRGLMSLPLLNFENLVWILERGRPTLARHLAGSRPMREQREAEACKYKCNLLDRVLKVPHETPRKRAFRLKSGGYTSGSDSVDPAPRYVEQGVDEVLNMLMSQTGFSIKDPATLVLASGDGAPGEFSSGYFDLIQTFLEREWKVEIYSFKQNLSHLYQAPAFRRRWGKQFNIIELDEYVLFLVQQIED